MKAFDTRDFEWYKELSAADRKQLTFWTLMRWASSVQNNSKEIEYHYLTMVNNFVNVHFNKLRAHPELQWRLLQLVGIGTSMYHVWIPPGKQKKNTKNKLYKFYEEFFPNLNSIEISILLNKIPVEEHRQFLTDNGLSEKEIKEMIKNASL